MASLPINFFKVILKTNLKRLKIPNKFSCKYGSGLPNPLFMKPPDGTEWKVNWAEDKGEIWLEKGWKEFVEHYSLDQGHFIFFKYEGTSQIHVIILDQSALEIDYPCGNGDENDNLVKTEEESDMVLDEGQDVKDEQIRGEKCGERTSSLNRPTQSRAREVACNFVSCNPFFTVFIRPSHAATYRLSVPDLRGLIGEKERYAMLELGERGWKVKLIANNSSYFSHHKFTTGWYLFLRETELQSGDVCVFELISKEDCVFKVHVFKNHT
ncbi:hypothetical protein ACSQ67_013580 [Phaseolus vulgaris]